MSDDVPPREAVLACADPRALFGDAVDDTRALKRAYAALVKVYRAGQDDDVFRHVRALYEAARAGEVASPSAPPRDPAAQLTASVATGDAGAVVQQLADELGELVSSSPEEVVRALQFLVFAAGPWLSRDARAVVEVALARPGLRMHPGMAEMLGADLVVLEALDEAQADPEVPEGFVHALRKGWRRSAADVARAWGAAPPLLDVDALFRHLDEVHAGVLGVVQRQALRMRKGRRPHLEEAHIARLRSRYAPMAELARGEGLNLVQVGVAMACGLVAFWWSEGGFAELFAVSFFVRLVLAYPFSVLRWRAARQHLANVRVTGVEELSEVARARGLFPSEVVDELTMDDGEVDVETVSYPVGHPLLGFRTDLAIVWKTLSPAHQARLDAAAVDHA